MRINSAPSTFPLGVDVGPNVHDRGGFISTNGSHWQNLSDNNPALDFNWNIRAVIAAAPSPTHDVGVTRILVPATNIPVGAYAPACRIVNFGANSESDIPVTCWIDSGGGHVYSKDTTYAGPLAPGARTDFTFAPDWNTGPAGNYYDITMFTGLSGDLNNANDTARRTTYVAAKFAVMDHDTGYCKLAVACLGSIGYDVPPSFDAGSGFLYPKTSGTSSLFYASLAIGNDTGWVADHYYSHPTSGGPNTDFVPTESLSAVVPPGIGDQHYRGAFNDAGHPSPKGLTVTQNSYMSAASGYDDFIVLDYAITNNDTSAINGVYAGVFADFDLGTDRLDFCRSDTVGRSIKMWHQNSQNPTVGLKILHPGWFRNLTAVDHNVWVYPDTCVTDNQKFRFLNGTIVLRNSNRPYDWSMVASVGPFDLAPGDSQKFAVAVIGASDTATFRANADSTQSWYYSNLGIAERPLALSSVLRIGAAPNPFSGATRVSYTALTAGRIEIEAYDVTGRLVDRLVTNVKAGPGTVNWKPRELGVGIYFLKVKTPDNESVIKALLTE